MRTRWLAAVLAGFLATGCSANAVTPQITVPVLAPIAPQAAAAPTRTPEEVLVRAATVASEQSGFNFSFDLTLSGLPEANGATLGVTGAGTVDHAQRRSAVSLDLGGVLAAARLAGENGAEIEELLGDGKIELLQDGATVYVRMPFLARELGVTTPWVSLTVPEAPTEGTTPLPALFTQLGGTGPAGSLAQLQAIDGSVVEDGTAVVRGVTTTRYRGTLDLAKLLGSSVPTTEATQLEAMMPFFQALRLPYEVYVDAEGLPRRLATTLDLGTLAPAGSAMPGPAPALTFTYDLFGFGTPAAIELPVAARVTALDPSVLTALR